MNIHNEFKKQINNALLLTSFLGIDVFYQVQKRVEIWCCEQLCHKFHNTGIFYKAKVNVIYT